MVGWGAGIGIDAYGGGLRRRIVCSNITRTGRVSSDATEASPARDTRPQTHVWRPRGSALPTALAVKQLRFPEPFASARSARPRPATALAKTRLPRGRHGGPGSGVAGSRPSNTTKVTGGALPLGTEATSALAVDPWRGDVWVCGYSPTGAATPKLYRLPHEDQTAWQQMPDVSNQYAEGCMIPQTMTVIDGRCRIGTASNGTLRRLS